MQKDLIEKKVEILVEPLLAGTNIELVDVEYTREGQWYLRIFLDKPGGIEIEDCQQLSEKVAALLDQEDFIKERYFLEVSSPGLGRKLRKERDFIRHKGEVVDLKLKNDKKIYVGILHDFSEEFVELLIEEKPEKFACPLIAGVNLHLDF